MTAGRRLCLQRLLWSNGVLHRACSGLRMAVYAEPSVTRCLGSCGTTCMGAWLHVWLGLWYRLCGNRFNELSMVERDSACLFLLR